MADLIGQTLSHHRITATRGTTQLHIVTSWTSLLE